MAGFVHTHTQAARRSEGVKLRAVSKTQQRSSGEHTVLDLLEPNGLSTVTGTQAEKQQWDPRVRPGQRQQIRVKVTSKTKLALPHSSRLFPSLSVLGSIPSVLQQLLQLQLPGSIFRPKVCTSQG